MTFSVVIPVYNVAPYLRACLDSVLEQTFADWEAICVDDGSTDGSATILDEYAAKDRRFRVIHQPNAGVSAARNAGLNAAMGEWLTFLDADDVFSKSAFDRIREQFESHSAADLIRFGIKRFAAGGEFCSDCPSTGVGTPHDISSSLAGTPMYDFTTFAYRRRLLEGIRFDGLVVGEDVLFLSKVLLRAKLMASMPDELYGYRQRGGSATNSPMSKRKLFDQIFVSEQILRLYSQTEKAVPEAYWRLQCNSLMEDVPFLCRSLKRAESREVADRWIQAVSSVKNLRNIPVRQKIRMAWIVLFRFFMPLLCTFPCWLKRKGVHR